MTTRLLIRAFEKWRDGDEPLVLATVYSTEGSTYSKTGAQMLISADGIYQGMLSGGCLEGDLAEHASSVIRTGVPQALTYDLGQDDDELWGLGVGCDGLMRVFLQLIDERSDYQPFTSMQEAYQGTDTWLGITVVSSEAPQLSVGSALVSDGSTIRWTNTSDRFHKPLMTAVKSAIDDDRSKLLSTEIDGVGCELLVSILRPAPKVLLLGAGLDAEPVVRLIVELGWRVAIADHRPAYIANGDFRGADEVCTVVATELAARFNLNEFSAAVVMSHHLATDEVYLRQLAQTDIAYIGLLGPPHRRNRLLTSLGDAATNIADRLHGPAGLDINATGPASIALSIVAEIHREIVRPYRD